MIDAVVPIWKPLGWTSFDVVRKIRSQVRPSKVGHAGTLDPFAEGILMLCIGKMTKSVELIMDKEKIYEAVICLGKQTDTLDNEGKVIITDELPELNENLINGVLNDFVGEISQVPPMYSALKVKGQRLYKLARAGKILNIPPRLVKVNSIKLLDYSKTKISIRVQCGRGTYIRALARDISVKLGTVGYLTSLVRTHIGEYGQDDAVSVEEFATWLSVVH